MMDTTTTDGGPQGQPEETSAAVAAGHNEDQVIVTDDNGTPTMQPVGTDESATSQSEGATNNAAPEPQGEETQAPAPGSQESDDIEAWAKKKGLPLDDPKKLAGMYRDAEKKMHQATEKAREFENTVSQQPVDYTGDPNIDSLAQTVNQFVVKQNVRDFFADNPEAREFESKMAEIVTNRPHLRNDLDALYALARNDKSRESDLRQQGGREALTNLAQKQQQIPPGANATNSGVYASQSAITPANVYDLIDKNDQKWFEKNHEAINKAISGK